MLLISHRGNTKGPEEQKENLPIRVRNLLLSGYHVEVDVWWIEDNFFLGHDSPQYKILPLFLKHENLWCHAKNLDALIKMKSFGIKRFFWHQNDDYTLTSEGIIWTFPNKICPEDGIIVCQTLEETKEMFTKNIRGICSDWIDLL